MVRQFRDFQGYLAVRACFAAAFVFFSLGMSSPVIAQDVSDVTDNIIDSVNFIPAFISAIAYLLGLLFGISGILRLKAHVENPGTGASSGQMTLKSPLIRLVIGGGFFALPIVLESLLITFNGGEIADDDFISNSFINAGSGLFGNFSSFFPTFNVSSVLANIVDSIERTPDLIAAFAYLLGLILTVIGLVKVKEHVENPEQTTLKEPVIRFLTAGALFALPTIYNAMFASIDGPSDGGILSGITSFFGGLNLFASTYAGTACSPLAAGASLAGSFASAVGEDLGLGSSTTGDLICGIVTHSAAFPAFLSAIAYLFGLVLGVWGILKIRDHVVNPTQVDMMQGVARLIAGGGFFALPVIVEVFRNTVSNAALSGSTLLSINTGTIVDTITGSLGLGSGACGDVVADGIGVDGMLVCLINDIFGPIHIVLNFFAFVAGMILIMIGISRLIKGAQEGAKAPGGLGTMMSFIIGGALISYNEMVRAASTTFAGSPFTHTYAALTYDEGLAENEVAAANRILTAVLKFMIIIGLISFVRGLFIVRNVAEGNQQASMMAAVTHLVAGALCVNLGSLITALQNTLGISTYGITFG